MMNLLYLYFYLFSILFGGENYNQSGFERTEKIEIGVENIYVASFDTYKSISEISSNNSIAWQKLESAAFAKPYDKKHYWIKIRVNVREDGSYFFLNDYTMLEKLELYTIDKNNDIRFYGFRGMEDERNRINFSFPVYKLNLKQGGYDLYLYQFKNFSTATQTIQILTESDFTDFLYSYQFKNGIIYSFFVLLFLQGLITSFLFRSKKYLIFCAYLLCLFLIFTIAEGGYQHIIPIHWHRNFYFLIYYAIAGSFLCLFLLLKALIPSKSIDSILSKSIFSFFGFVWILLSINHYAFIHLPNFPLIIFKVSNLLLSILPISLCILALYFYFKFKFKEALWMLIIFGFTMFFVLAFSILPFVGIKFSYFVQFKWIIVFESIAVLVVLYKDLYSVSKEKRTLEHRLKKEKFESALNYISGISEERQRIAAQLHDDVSLNINLLYKNIENQIEDESLPNQQTLHQLDEIREKVRRASHVIHPFILDNLNIKEAIEYEIQKIEDSFNSFIIIPNILIESLNNQKIEEMFYLTFLEIIQNAIKYSDATEIKISFYEENQQAVLKIEENGSGFNSDENYKNSLGLQSIKKRAKIMGGIFEISLINNGLQHVFCLPLIKK